MPVRPLVTTAPRLGRRLSQCSRARDLLGARHPLVHVVDDMRVMGEQSIVVAMMLAASLSALLADVSEARAAVAAALAVQVAVAWRLVLRASAKRDLVLDLNRRWTGGSSAAVGRVRAPAPAGRQAPRPAGTCAGCASRRGRNPPRPALVTSRALQPACHRHRHAGARRNCPGAAANGRERARRRAERAPPVRSRLAAVRERRRSASRGAPAHPLPALDVRAVTDRAEGQRRELACFAPHVLAAAARSTVVSGMFRPSCQERKFPARHEQRRDPGRQ